MGVPLTLAAVLAAGSLTALTASRASADTNQTALVRQLENIKDFLTSPVDPQGTPLPDDPYAATLSVLDPYFEMVNTTALTSTQVAELQNVVDVLSLVVGCVSNSSSQSLAQIASENDTTSCGQWGISYRVSLAIGQRYVDAGVNVAKIVEQLATDGVGKSITAAAQGFLSSLASGATSLVVTVLNYEVKASTDLGTTALTNIIDGFFTQELKLQTVGGDTAGGIADWLTTFDGYAIDPFLAQAVAQAMGIPVSAAPATVQNILTSMSGPANTALETTQLLDVLSTNASIGAAINLIEAIPFIGGASTVIASGGEVDADLGASQVDIEYLFEPIGNIDPALFTDSLWHDWTVGENQILQTAVVLESSTPYAMTQLSLESSASECTGLSSSAFACEQGALVGISGTVTNSSGNPVVDAQVDVIASDGILTSGSVMTDSAGRFADGIVIPTSVGEDFTITATADGTSLSKQAEVTVEPGSPYTLSLVSPSVYSAGTTSIPVEGILTDYYDNGISGTTVDLSSSVGSVSMSTTTTGSEGTFQATVTIPPGTSSVTITARVPGTFLSESIITKSGAPPELALNTPTVTGLTCKINGSAAAVTSGTSISWVLWQWGDGATTTSTMFPQSHTYTTTGSHTVTVTATDSDGDAASMSEACDVSAPVGLTISPTLRIASVGTAYSATIGISGGTAPYSFSWSGSLPPGLYFYSGTTLSGTPEQSGIYAIQVVVTDSSNPEMKVSEAVAVVVQADSVPIIEPTSIPNGTLNDPYSASIQVVGGKSPYTISHSALPTGLAFNQASGMLSGTPLVAGSYVFTFEVVDANNVVATQQYEMSVGDPIVATTGEFIEQYLAPSGTQLQGIQCLPDKSTVDCWVIGTGNTGPIMLRTVNDGASWTQEVIPAGLKKGAAGIDCPALNTCYATSGYGVIKTTNGTDWSLLAGSSTVTETSAPSTSISCPTTLICFVTSGLSLNSSQDVYETTDGGASWHEIATCASCAGSVTGTIQFNESGISCPSATTCYAPGYESQFGNTSAAMLTTSDGGSTWSVQQGMFGGASTLYGSDCLTQTQCWVVGQPSGILGEPTYPYVASTTDGTTWSPYTTGQTSSFGGGEPGGTISCVSSSACVVVNRLVVGVFVTTDGGSDWTNEALPSGAGQVFGTSCVTTGQCFAVTSSGAIAATALEGAPPADAATQLEIASPGATGVASDNASLGPISIVELDSSGNPTTAPPGGTVIDLSSSSAGGFFSTSLDGPHTSAVTIPAGSSSASVYYGQLVSGASVIDASSGSLLSAQQQVLVTQPPVPGLPTHLKVIAGSELLRITWGRPASSGGAPISEYTATASNGFSKGICVTSKDSCTVTGLNSNLPYSIRVSAANKYGSGPATTILYAVYPVSAKNLSVQVIPEVVEAGVAFITLAYGVSVGKSIALNVAGKALSCTTNEAMQCFVKTTVAKPGSWTAKASSGTVKASTRFWAPLVVVPPTAIGGKDFTVSFSTSQPAAAIEVKLSDGRSFATSANSVGKATVTIRAKAKGTLTVVVTIGGTTFTARTVKVT